MKQKFQLPEAIFNVTENFPEPTQPEWPNSKILTSDINEPDTLAAKTTKASSRKVQLKSNSILKIAKWPTLIAISAIIIMMAD
ncbi:MAG: hypothetical protein PHD12_03090 [Methylotenera sp.]|nr:hypothetical protein [Methylotenera sp.]